MTLEQETALLATITGPLEKINRRAVEEAARQLKKIGTLSAKNIDQLNMQHEAGMAASEIMAAVARAADTTVKHVYEVLEAVAKSEYSASEPLFAFKGVDQIPYEKNRKMRRNVRAIARRTAETMTNISLTRGENVGLKTSEGFLPLKKAYKKILDEGIQSVVFGGKSYDEATRDAIKTFGGNGLRVQYDSGNTRRIDSAVRMNTLDGIRAVNAEVQAEIAETIKSEKVEISVHLPPLYCAPDHIEYQGLVMTRKELDNLNSTTLAYPKRVIAVGALNCRHYTLAFLDGISKPRYTPEQLAEIVRSAKEIHEVTYTDRSGKEQQWSGTLYEATQVQRQMETALRYAKEAHNASKIAENKTLESELRREITARGREYRSFSESIGLKAQEAKTRVKSSDSVSEQEIEAARELSDSAAWKDMKRTIGDNAPESLAEFKHIKYTEGERWRKVVENQRLFEKINHTDTYSAEYKAKMKETYQYFLKEGFEFREHALNRVLGQKSGPGKFSFTREQLLSVLRRPLNYRQADGKLIRFYDGIAVIAAPDTGEIVSIVIRSQPKKDWEAP